VIAPVLVPLSVVVRDPVELRVPVRVSVFVAVCVLEDVCVGDDVMVADPLEVVVDETVNGGLLVPVAVVVGVRERVSLDVNGGVCAAVGVMDCDAVVDRLSVLDEVTVFERVDSAEGAAEGEAVWEGVVAAVPDRDGVLVPEGVREGDDEEVANGLKEDVMDCEAVCVFVGVMAAVETGVACAEPERVPDAVILLEGL